MIYFEKTASLMYDVSNNTAPTLINNLVTKTSNVHNYSTRSATRANYYINHSRLEIQRLSLSRSGPVIWNCLPDYVRNESKRKFKQKIHVLLRNILETENDYVDIPKIIQKIAL